MTESSHISCDLCQERLEEFALDELSDSEGRQVSDHLASGCYVCNLQLAQIVADWSVTPKLLPRELPPLRIERELLNQIAGRSTPPVIAAAAPPPPAKSTPVVRRSNKRLLAATLAAAAALFGISAWTAWRANQTGEAAYQAELERRFQQADKSQHFTDIPELNFTYVNNPPPSAPVHGYIVADNIARQWHIYLFDLAPLESGRAHAIWLVTQDQKYLFAGTLEVDSRGTASKLLDLPSNAPLAGIAVSDEPISGSSMPSGPNFAKADLP
jgi:hypothetical protein